MGGGQKVNGKVRARVKGEKDFPERPVNKAFHLKAAPISGASTAPAVGTDGVVALTLRYLESSASASSASSLDISALSARAKHSVLRGESQLELKAQRHPPQHVRGP